MLLLDMRRPMRPVLLSACVMWTDQGGQRGCGRAAAAMGHTCMANLVLASGWFILFGCECWLAFLGVLGTSNVQKIL